MNRETFISRTDGWLAAQIDEDLIMMSADSTVYLALSGTGRRIWELLEQPRSLDSLCEALTGEYDAPPEQIVREAMTFLENLKTQHAIEVHTSPGS